MRKLIALSLVTLLLICGTANAEVNIDLTTMTLDELVELHALLDAEIDARIACEPSLLPAGVYIGGESIKPGKYVISTDADSDATIIVFASRDIYNQAIAENDESLVTYMADLWYNESAFVNIGEGTVLIVSDAAYIQAAQADWMP